jgi:hypothetical protein
LLGLAKHSFASPRTARQFTARILALQYNQNILASLRPALLGQS